jgi:ubiquitin-like modifier-activating enzyme ATG7
VEQTSSDTQDPASGPSIPGSRKLSPEESSALVDAVQTWKANEDVCQHGFFLARREKKKPVSDNAETTSETYNWKVSTLAGFETGFFRGSKFEDMYFCFADPSNYPNAPGWMLRNLLALLQRRWGITKIQILFYREIQSKRDIGRSLAVTLEVDTKVTSNLASNEMPKITGWERNSAGKLAGRISDLTAYMDPRK